MIQYRAYSYCYPTNVVEARDITITVAVHVPRTDGYDNSASITISFMSDFWTESHPRTRTKAIVVSLRQEYYAPRCSRMIELKVLVTFVDIHMDVSKALQVISHRIIRKLNT